MRFGRLSALVFTLGACAAAPEVALTTHVAPPTAKGAPVSPEPKATPRTEAAFPPAPVARREAKTFTVHGRTFTDDYAWLRKRDDPEVLAYLRAENAYADAVVAPMKPFTDKLYDEMVARVPEDDVSAPVREAGAFYYHRTLKGKEHIVLCRKVGHLDAEEQVLIDLNAVAKVFKFAGLGERAVSPSGKYVAFGVDKAGYRQYQLQIVEGATGRVLQDTAPRVTSLAFADDDTLFYTVEDAVSKRSHRLYRHTIDKAGGQKGGGEGGASDTLVYEEPDERFEIEIERLRGGTFLALNIESHTASETRLIRTQTPRQAPLVFRARKADLEYTVDQQGDRLLVRTNDRGRNFRVVAVPVNKLDAEPKELIAHSDDVMLESLEAFRDHFVVKERARGLPRLRVVGAKETHVVTMPEAAYELKLDGNREYDTRLLRFVYQSPTTPAQTFDYDVVTRERKTVKRAEVRGGFDRERYEVRRIEVPVRDGVKVPVTMLSLRGTQPDGKSPVVLYGYGAYGYPTPASFSSARLSLVDRGVTWAIAHVRGGGELGKRWHDDGRMAHKHRTFEDFVDVGEHLVNAGWAKRGALGAWGASAGGLLMGAVANLRPDLFRVIVAEVPFVDVVSTMLDETLPLTVGEFEEWGNPKKAEELGWLAAYSPYDNLAAKAYPAMLVRSAYNDSQVMYWEPAKYVAKLRTLKQSSELLLMRMMLDPAGHGGRSGRYEKLKDTAADYAFVLWQLGAWPG